MAAMGAQMGVYARLTWWEYSWDIMEPVTYFTTYATVIGSFGYYLLTRQVHFLRFFRAIDRRGFVWICEILHLAGILVFGPLNPIVITQRNCAKQFRRVT
uniref:Calcium uniporter protein n=1 Tax=Plectus sambesii TaxID=2011161 RepID=A0A914XB59_9BILA